jgi:hypothetical protein
VGGRGPGLPRQSTEEPLSRRNAIRPEAYAWKIRKLPATAAYSYLNKLHQWGLLWRQENPVRYRISQRGRERLAWLRERFRPERSNNTS